MILKYIVTIKDFQFANFNVKLIEKISFFFKEKYHFRLFKLIFAEFKQALNL